MRRAILAKKNNPEVKRGRGRPRKVRPSKTIWKLPEGVRFVARNRNHSQALTHRWVAYKNNQVVGYYKTPKEAKDALNK